MSKRVVRGGGRHMLCVGSCGFALRSLRSAFRNVSYDDSRFSSLGFRLLQEDAMDPDLAFRGGSWLNAAWYCRSAFRCRREPDSRDDDLGFRLVQEISND